MNWQSELIDSGPNGGPGPNLNGNLDIRAVGWGGQRLDIYGINDESSHIEHWWRPDSATLWQGPDVQWQNAAQTIDVCSWAANRLDLFMIGADADVSVPGPDQLVHYWYDGAWAPPESLFPNRSLTAGVSVVSWGTGRLDVFSVDAETRQLFHSWFPDQGGHFGGELLGGALEGPPAAVAIHNGRLDVVAVGQDPTTIDGNTVLLHWWYDQSVAPVVSFLRTPTVRDRGPVSANKLAVNYGHDFFNVYGREENALTLWTGGGSGLWPKTVWNGTVTSDPNCTVVFGPQPGDQVEFVFATVDDSALPAGSVDDSSFMLGLWSGDNPVSTSPSFVLGHSVGRNTGQAPATAATEDLVTHVFGVQNPAQGTSGSIWHFFA